MASYLNGERRAHKANKEEEERNETDQRAREMEYKKSGAATKGPKRISNVYGELMVNTWGGRKNCLFPFYNGFQKKPSVQSNTKTGTDRTVRLYVTVTYNHLVWHAKMMALAGSLTKGI